MTVITHLEKRFDFDDNSSLKTSTLSFVDNSFPNISNFMKLFQDLKLKDKLKLNMDDLFDEVMSIRNCFDTIKNSEDFAKCKTTSSKWNKIFKPSGVTNVGKFSK